MGSYDFANRDTLPVNFLRLINIGKMYPPKCENTYNVIFN